MFEAPCLNHVVESFSCSSKDVYHIEGEMGMPLPPFVARFSPDLLNGHLISVADEDGHVMLIDTNKSKGDSTVKEWPAHSNAVFDLAWLKNEAKLVTASGDQTARLWDVEKAETLAIFRGHTCSLKSIAVHPSSSYIFLTGARDGNIMLWDTRCYTRNGFTNPVSIIPNAHILPQKEAVTGSGKKRRTRRTLVANADTKQSVTSVVFQDTKSIISSGACDGALKYWDIRRNSTNHKSEPTSLHKIPFPGYSSLALSSSRSRLFAVCTNDIIYEYCTLNLSKHPVATYDGHLASSFYIKASLSPDDRFLLCGSGDNNAYIWRTDQPGSSPWLLKGHCGEVTSVSWSPHVGEKIITCSDDNTFKVWRLFPRISDECVAAGHCERKTPEIDSVVVPTDKTSVATTKTSCHCKPTNLISGRVNSTFWRCVPVVLSKECQSPLPQTPDTPKFPPESPFTSVTPKRNLRQKILTPTSGNSLPSPTSSRGAVTPKSSRLFMESWLKSPSTNALPPKLEKISEEENIDRNLTLDVKADKQQITEPKRNKLSIIPLNTKKPNQGKSVNDKVIKKIISKPNTSSRKRKSNTMQTDKPSGNIRTLMLKPKRKRDSESTETDKPVKLLKIDKENTVVMTTPQIKTNKSEYGQDGGEVKDLLDHAEETPI